MANRKALNDQLRNDYIKQIITALDNAGEDVGLTGANEFNLPVVDAEGNEEWIVVKVSVPTGSRDGEAYDGYGMREDYDIRTKEKVAKAKEVAAKKQAKIARDEKRRAEAKALREAHKE